MVMTSTVDIPGLLAGALLSEQGLALIPEEDLSFGVAAEVLACHTAVSSAAAYLDMHGYDRQVLDELDSGARRLRAVLSGGGDRVQERDRPNVEYIVRSLDRVLHSVSQPELAKLFQATRRTMSIFSSGAAAIAAARADLGAPLQVSPATHPIFYNPVSVLDLSEGTVRLLGQIGIRYVGELVELDLHYLIHLTPQASVGLEEIREIYKALRIENLNLDMELEGFSRADAERLERERNSGSGVPLP